MKYLIPVVLILVSACTAVESDMTENKTFCLEEPFKSEVEWLTIAKEAVVEGIHLTGSVEANPDRVVHFVSLVGGVVSNTFFSLGDVTSVPLKSGRFKN